MSERRTIEDIWSHYGRDATGGGHSEIEILERLRSALTEGRLDDARATLPDVKGIAQSYGYGEADAFLSDGWDPDTAEGEAQTNAYENALSDGDYASCIDATTNGFTSTFPEGEANDIAKEMGDVMHDGYANGRRLREEMVATPSAPRP